MSKFNTIAVACDFSDGSRAALAQAARLAKSDGAALHAIHVVRHDAADELRQLAPDASASIAAYLTEAAETELRSRLAEAGAPEGVRVSVVAGKPAAEITRLSEGADLLVMGATGEGHNRFGTVAGRCVRHAKCPTMLVQPGHDGPFRTVVVGIDFGAGCPAVLGAAIDAAKRDGGSVVAVHAFEVPWERARFSAPPADAQRLTDQLEGVHRTRFASLCPKDTGGVEVRFELVRDIDGGDALVAFAGEQGADLVVTGLTGRSSLGYLLLGTTAEKVMRDTACSVLAVR